MQTVKHPFGETPEDVIRDRVANFIELDIPILPEYWWTHHLIHTASAKEDCTDLLTVLDNAKSVGELKASRHADKAAKARRLRIDILAALEIDEGGA